MIGTSAVTSNPLLRVVNVWATRTLPSRLPPALTFAPAHVASTLVTRFGGDGGGEDGEGGCCGVCLRFLPFLWCLRLATAAGDRRRAVRPSPTLVKERRTSRREGTWLTVRVTAVRWR